jgi:hypothetical protein
MSFSGKLFLCSCLHKNSSRLKIFDFEIVNVHFCYLSTLDVNENAVKTRGGNNEATRC